MELSVEPLLYLCWVGHAQSLATDVQHACERAVTLIPDDDDKRREIRGMIRALSGDYHGAIAESAESLRYFCWLGHMKSLAATVQHACEWAVTLIPDDDDKRREIRGITRALAGDSHGAIADLESALTGGYPLQPGQASVSPVP